MRKPKEVRLIEHGDEVLKELHKVYLEGIGIDEYYKLLTEYKKLYKRYEKTIKLADNMGSGIMNQNDTLSDNLQYTIKTARNKLMDNVTEHRKTKEVSSRYQQRAKSIEDALEESYLEQNKLQKRLKYYIDTYGEIKHSFADEGPKDVKGKALEINSIEHKNMSIKQVLSLELSKNDLDNFVLIKIKLNNFENMIETIEKSSSVKNFIFGIFKYLKNNFSKEDVVFHSYREEFYIMSKRKKIHELKSHLIKVNQKRTVLNFAINYTLGMSVYKKGADTSDILLKRCDRAFAEALSTNQSLIEK